MLVIVSSLSYLVAGLAALSATVLHASHNHPASRQGHSLSSLFIEPYLPSPVHPVLLIRAVLKAPIDGQVVLRYLVGERFIHCESATQSEGRLMTKKYRFLRHKKHKGKLNCKSIKADEYQSYFGMAINCLFTCSVMVSYGLLWSCPYSSLVSNERWDYKPLRNL
jgi:hypothetical protein